MSIDPSIFRAYDIRGVYPDQLNEEVVYAIARNADTIYPKESLIIVGHDTRTNGDQLARMVARGLKEAGMRVAEVGMMSTPMATFFINTMNAGGAMVITASHSPAQFNGIKFSGGDGVAIGGGEVYRAMKKRLKKEQPEIGNIVDLSEKTPSTPYITEYVEWLAGLWNPSRDVSIVCDASNGATGPIVEELASYTKKREMPITWTLLNTTPDSQFSAHGPDPTMPFAWKQAQETIRKTKADMGVVLDGDGDRAVFFDETGAVTRAEYVWRLLMVGRSGGACVYDATVGYMTTLLANQLRDEHDRMVSAHESKVGHLFITKAMHEHNASLGFEASGHYYFPEIGGVSSGLAATLAVTSSLSALPYSLRTYTELLPASYRAMEVDVNGDGDWRHAEKRLRHYAKQKGMDVSTKDGVSITGKHMWANARPSNTSDVVRVNAEGERQNDVLRLQKEIVAIVRG